MGKPSDIAAAMLFLASNEAEYVTGQTIIVDGGRISGAIFTGDGTDEVTVQGEGVELGLGVHAGGEGEAADIRNKP